MPKRFATIISVTGPNKSLSALAQRAKGAPARYAHDPVGIPAIQHMSFHALIPVPARLLNRRYARRSKAGVADSGRDWELAHWGCGRGAIQSARMRRPGLLMFIVLTLNAPPIKFVESICAIFPGLKFHVLSIDPRTLEEMTDRFANGRRVLMKGKPKKRPVK